MSSRTIPESALYMIGAIDEVKQPTERSRRRAARRSEPPLLMRLRILLPFRIFAKVHDVLRYRRETPDGAVGSCRIDAIVWPR